MFEYENTQQTAESTETTEAASGTAEAAEALSSLIVELAQAKDRFARLGADFNNYKRRSEMERTAASVSAYAEVITKFLPLVDDLGRALDAFTPVQAEESGAAAIAFREGVSLIAANAKKSIAALGITEIEATGPFNPDLHEALMHVDSPDHASGEIVTVFVAGYTYKGLVVRHAKVSVAR